MENWQIIASLSVLSAVIGYTHVRINQVRSEVIDIADRNLKAVNQVADYVRAEFTMRTAALKESQEQLRKESREDARELKEDIKSDLKDVKDEMNKKLSEILALVRQPSARTLTR